MTDQITVEVFVDAPVDVTWQAYTTPADIMQWNFASPDWCCPTAEVDLRVGGAFSSRMEARDGSMGFDFAGVYTAVEPERLLEYRFGARQAAVTFEADGGGTRVSVRFDPETTHSEAQQRDGWAAILGNFARHAEGL